MSKQTNKCIRCEFYKVMEVLMLRGIIKVKATCLAGQYPKRSVKCGSFSKKIAANKKASKLE